MKKNIFYFLVTMLLVVIQLQVNAQTAENAIRLSQIGKYDEAEINFTALLHKDENNIGLLIASGFNNAWNKKFTSAQKRFKRVLQLEPNNTDAAKGMAYTFLYKGCYSKAATAFSKLSYHQPSSEEFQMALGLAYMNMGKKVKAQAAFEKVLKINKDNKEAHKYIKAIHAEKGIVELSVLAGLSNYDEETKFGLRQIQAGYHINHALFLYARYDNSLSMDNYNFLKNNYNANAFMGGIYTRWHHRIGSKFEYGSRSLPGSINQNIFQTEQTVFLPKKFLVKLGGAYITSNQLENEWMLMSSISIPITKKLKIEPHYYFIRRSSDEHRILLNASYQFSSNSDVAIGVFNGSEKNIKTNIHTNVFGIYSYSNFRIKGPVSAILLARYERDAFERNAFTAAFGLKLSMNTKRL